MNPVGHGFAQAVLANVAHHAHDCPPLLLTGGLDVLADGILSGPEMLGRGRGNQQGWYSGCGFRRVAAAEFRASFPTRPPYRAAGRSEERGVGKERLALGAPSQL